MSEKQKKGRALRGANISIYIDHEKLLCLDALSETTGCTRSILVQYMLDSALEEMTLSRETARFKEMISKKYGEIIYGGLWFTDLRESLDAFIKSTQKVVNGAVRLRLYKGACTVIARKSPCSLYDMHLSTYAEGDTFNHQAAQGFLDIYNLEIKSQGFRRKKCEQGECGD